jgi:hypothetical protein
MWGSKNGLQQLLFPFSITTKIKSTFLKTLRGIA